MEPLYPNPGGTVDPDELVGRVVELQRLHESLARGGAHVVGERRMGKTSLLVKLQAELEAAGRTVVRISAETSELGVFTDRLLRELRANRLISKRISFWEKEIQGSVGLAIGQTGLKLTGTAKTNPGSATELDLLDLLATVGDRGGAVLIIDEITVLCFALGPDAAVEFLRALRTERQGRRPLPLVISGSMGLHHALRDTQAVNDLWLVEIGPLTDPEARELTERLLLGAGLPRDDEHIGAIIEATSRIPYYIQAVVDRLRQLPGQDVPSLVERCIVENDWHTEHYVSRLDTYYGDEAAVARAALDTLAISHPEPLGMDEIGNRLVATLGTGPTRDHLLDLLGRLERDHYLTRTGMRDRMSSDLLAQVWRLHRRLG